MIKFLVKSWHSVYLNICTVLRSNLKWYLPLFIIRVACKSARMFVFPHNILELFGSWKWNYNKMPMCKCPNFLITILWCWDFQSCKGFGCSVLITLKQLWKFHARCVALEKNLQHAILCLHFYSWTAVQWPFVLIWSSPSSSYWMGVHITHLLHMFAICGSVI